MDAQTRSADNVALAALAQSVVRLEATEGYAHEAIACRPEVLDENRFLATRDGMRAAFLDPERRGAQAGARDPRGAARRVRAARRRARLRGRAGLVRGLAAAPGDHRQRLLAGVEQGDAVGPGLGMLVAALANDFGTGLAQPAALA